MHRWNMSHPIVSAMVCMEATTDSLAKPTHMGACLTCAADEVVAGGSVDIDVSFSGVQIYSKVHRVCRVEDVGMVEVDAPC